MPQCLSVILSSAPPDIQKVEEDAEWLVEALERPELFRETHQCRTPELPPPLADAYAHAGSVWRGSSVLRDYVAEPPSLNAAVLPSALVMRGEHDFVLSTSPWKQILNSRSVREKEMPGCSHHGLLEDPVNYGETIESFFAEYD